MTPDAGSGPDASQVATRLLDWYDRHHRTMPWRVPPAERAAGVRPDPYRVWLSEVMLQQTTVAAVRGYFERFTARWPTVQDLAAAEDAAVMAEWAGLGYYARARNLLKCARAVAARGGFPDTRDALLALPGIGPYTAAAVAAIAYDEPVAVVDGNVERVTARLFAVEAPLPGARPWLAALAVTLTPEARPGDFAQAMMDLGATICTPRKPACALCPLTEGCLARAGGIAAELPRKSPKPEKPTRRGFAYVATDPSGAVLVETRPAKGLLGGMLGFPGSDWSASPEPAPPLSADWQARPDTVRHTFTHFHLELTVLTATAAAGTNPERGAFVARTAFDPGALPTVMRKVWDAAS
ncbi:A/G-specific adenine glycosylase [Frigidibacter sp. MR17.14]|uniref:A/G-specific adenine glycosylase n=1 Tax=Frigidibacter sp. MR17.14 TaxID=3126509 RepID=UPI003012E847